MVAPKQPKWTREEVMLALELFLRPLPDSLDYGVAIRELSDVLRQLALHPPEMIHENFRSELSVITKLLKLNETAWQIKSGHSSSDLMYFTGLLDWEIMLEFSEDYGRLKSYTDFWRAYGVVSESVFQDTKETSQPLGVEEGRLLLQQHLKRERNTRIVHKKLQNTLSRDGRLICEACGFNFQITYGRLGEGFAECHHIQPLGALLGDESVIVITMLDDLAVVCSNCHRMLHRGPALLSIEGLRSIMEAQAAILGKENKITADWMGKI